MRDFDGKEATIKEGLLVCPRCGDTYLHHHAVKVFERVAEDAGGSVTLVEGLRVSTRPAERGEIPHRRNTVRIAFTCEFCDSEDRVCRMALEIEQHKGLTCMRWVRWPD